LFLFCSLRRLLVAGCTLLVFAGVCYAGSGDSAGKSSHRAAPRRARTTVRHSAHRGRLVYAAEHKKSSKKYRHRRSRRKRGQQKIDAQRAREIQEALIREHYLSGKPDGIWGSATQKAMQRYQADNGWQTKTTPDSRALIKLGLGPDHAHLLNPDTAMTGVAEADVRTAADAKQPAKAVSAADAKAKPMVKPAADSEAVAPSAAAPANGDPAPAADSNPAAKPQK
jgi:hypothetical protein